MTGQIISSRSSIIVLTFCPCFPSQIDVWLTGSIVHESRFILFIFRRSLAVLLVVVELFTVQKSSQQKSNMLEIIGASVITHRLRKMHHRTGNTVRSCREMKLITDLEIRDKIMIIASLLLWMLAIGTPNDHLMCVLFWPSAAWENDAV